MEEYYIWSNEHRAWWRADARGYTIDLARAGIYGKMEAIRHCSVRDQEPGQPLPELPVRRDDVLSVIAPQAKSRAST